MVDVALVSKLVLNPKASVVVWVSFQVACFVWDRENGEDPHSGRDGSLVISFPVASGTLKVSSTTST